MAGTTTRLGLPYPTGTDRVMDGDNAIQALAEGLDFGGIRVSAALFPFGAAVNAVKKPTIHTAVAAVTLAAGGTYLWTFPQAFTSQVYYIGVTTLSGTAVAPVINSNAVSLTGVTLSWAGVAAGTNVNMVGIFIGI